MRFECRYSSSEMMYLEIVGKTVRCYLDHSPQHARTWSAAEVLGGDLETDGEVATLFDRSEIEQIKEALRNG